MIWNILLYCTFMFT